MTTKPPLTHNDLMEPRPSGASLLFRVFRVLRKAWHGVLPRWLPRKFIRGGVRYESDLTDYVARIIAMNGYLEPTQTLHFFGTARQGGADLFLDVGANFGYYSLTAARTGDFAEIHSVEAHPRTFHRLLANIKANDFAHGITPHNIAASDKKGELFIDTASSGAAKVSAKKRRETIAVCAADLDSVFQFRGRRIAVKMDLEGHEVAALKGMKNLLDQNAVLLQVEVLPENSDSLHFLFGGGWRCIYRIGGDFHFVNDKWTTARSNDSQ